MDTGNWMVLTPALAHVETVRPAGERVARTLDPGLIAVVTMAVSVTGIGRPSLWYDEAATISAASRPVSELWAMLHNIDAVHGLYYLLMHCWLAIFPATELFLRLPSTLAVGLAAAGVVVLAKQLSTRAVALTSGVVFALLPRVTWAGIEGRSYALTMAIAVWLTVLCVSAIRRRRAALWTTYTFGVIAATVVNVYVLLILGAHAALVGVLTSRRRAVIPWVLAVSVATLAVTPFLLFSRGQIGQVRWISPLGAHSVGEVFRAQYFDHSAAFAVLTGIILAATAVFRRPGRLLPDGAGWRLVVVAVVWIAVPTAVMLVYSAVNTPTYYPRYLSFTAPAMALLLGVGVVALARSTIYIAAIITLLAAAAAPNFFVVQRGPYANEGMDFSQVADVIAAHAAPGDCLALDNTATWQPGPIRALTAARPSVYERLVDPGRGKRAIDRNMLWDSHISIWAWTDVLRGCTVLWTVSDLDKTLPDHQAGDALPPGPRLTLAPAYQAAVDFGFRVVERWQFNFAQVVRSTR
ncbi:glycosyltransferase family 39 protein [soil metagenome]